MQFPKRANRELNAANSELNRTDQGNKSRLRELPIVDFQELTPEIWHQSGAVRQVVISTRRLR
jgi:hypothetical protein